MEKQLGNYSSNQEKNLNEVNISPMPETDKNYKPLKSNKLGWFLAGFIMILAFITFGIIYIAPIIKERKIEKCFMKTYGTNCSANIACKSKSASSFCKCMEGVVDIRKETENSEENEQSPIEKRDNIDYILEKSEGTCTTDSECAWSSQGCGGGHGICTNTPEKYTDMVSTCEVDSKFPTNLGYSCVCLETLGKCGWEK